MAEALSIKRILLIVDGTENGVHAARYAVKVAALHQAEIVALAVVDTAILKTLLKSSVLVEAEMMEFDEELVGSTQKNLAYASQLAKEAGVEAEILLKKGSAHSVVIGEAIDREPDLLVMGSFSTSLIKRDLNARARRLIVDEVKCPIVLVP